MFPVIAKVVAIIFCAYVSIDSYRKIGKIQYEVKESIINPKTGVVLKRRALRNSIIFGILALAAIGALFIKIAPLGE